MMDLISRQDAIDACLNGFCACVNDFVDEIEKLPSAQKTGKWIRNPAVWELKCSECGCEVEDYPIPWNYCPNCGARMEGKNENTSDTYDRE